VQRQVGKGRDLRSFASYVPGDSFDDIHWKATARARQADPKVFQIERTQEIYVVVDASGFPRQSILERSSRPRLCSVLPPTTRRPVRPVDVYRRCDSFVRARNGKTHYSGSGCPSRCSRRSSRPISMNFARASGFDCGRRALIGLPHFAWTIRRSQRISSERGSDPAQHLLMVNMIRQPGTTLMLYRSGVTSVDDGTGRSEVIYDAEAATVEKPSSAAVSIFHCSR